MNISRRTCLAATIGAGAAAVAGMPAAESSYNAVKLIPRDILFSDPEKAAPTISPDGKKIAYLAPLNGKRTTSSSFRSWTCLQCPALIHSARSVTFAGSPPELRIRESTPFMIHWLPSRMP